MSKLPPAITQPVHPVEINARTLARVLELHFDDGQKFEIAFELLRVYSPSAEVRGHGEGQEVLQTGQRLVNITGIEPVGHYAIKPIFSDGHATGIFTWAYLYWLGQHQSLLWENYLARLHAAGFVGESGRDTLMRAQQGGHCSN